MRKPRRLVAGDRIAAAVPARGMAAGLMRKPRRFVAGDRIAAAAPARRVARA